MSQTATAGFHRISFAWKSHRGNFRPNNEDAVLVADLNLPPTAGLPLNRPDGSDEPVGGGDFGEVHTERLGCLAVVCDGVGGGAAGEIASSLAASTVRTRLHLDSQASGSEATEATFHFRLGVAVQAAHQAIQTRVDQDRALEGMGTTLTAAWLCGSSLYLAQVGDSRLYRLRDGALEQLSQDQSLVGGLQRSGLISEAEARRHPLRNIIDQAVGGTTEALKPHLSVFDLRPGDELLVCSDGLTDALNNSSLRHVLLSHRSESVQEAARLLLRAALDTAGRDNVTLALLRVAPNRTGWWQAIRESLGRCWPGSG